MTTTTTTNSKILFTYISFKLLAIASLLLHDKHLKHTFAATKVTIHNQNNAPALLPPKLPHRLQVTAAIVRFLNFHFSPLFRGAMQCGQRVMTRHLLTVVHQLICPLAARLLSVSLFCRPLNLTSVLRRFCCCIFVFFVSRALLHYALLRVHHHVESPLPRRAAPSSALLLELHHQHQHQHHTIISSSIY